MIELTNVTKRYGNAWRFEKKNFVISGGVEYL